MSQTPSDPKVVVVASALDDRRVPEHLFVSGDRMDILSFAEAWEKGHGRKPKLECLGSLSELERETSRRLAAEPSNMFAWLPLMYARGVFGGQALLGASENARYPEVEPETLTQAISRRAL